jgi:cytochrome d ubiquinol oxidase subunit I
MTGQPEQDWRVLVDGSTSATSMPGKFAKPGSAFPDLEGVVMRFDAAVVVAAAHVSGDVVPARAQMAATLGFHIILACLGIAFPTIVLLAEFIGLRRHDEISIRLARRWSQAMGVLIAVGAVTGTVLSFEMGLLWPGLMRQYGAVLGFPFGVEGLFFFLEAIFTAIYLYGWRRLPGWAHFWSGMPIALSGILGAMSVIAVNSWMNQPGGFTEQGGRITSVNVWQVYFNHAAIYEMPHMILAAYMVTGFTVAGVYAAGILRGRRDRYHHTGFALGFVPAAVLTPFQIFVGDTAARAIVHDQPAKFASMEYVARTSRNVPEWLGGVYANGHIYAGLKIPYMDSLLAGFGPGTQVTGWNAVPPAPRPPVVWLSCGWPGSGGGAVACRRTGCSGWQARSAGWLRSWRWNAAGWLPRSAASRGWSTGCRPPPRRPPPTAASSPA